MFDLVGTFLELGDATSRNLEYSHEKGLSYGEETITETNLLGIGRRHPKLVHICTFSKRVEATNGADWEWHIIGRKLTLKIRVQAKRVQRDNILRVAHTVKSSGKQQHALLIEGAKKSGMKPIYCIYCTETQRSIWTSCKDKPGFKMFHTGCLVADAKHVPIGTRNLGQIERKCRPWHHLVTPHSETDKNWGYCSKWALWWDDEDTLLFQAREVIKGFSVENREMRNFTGWNPPTISDLNEDTKRDFDEEGVEETKAEDNERLSPESAQGKRRAKRDRERLQELGISRLFLMDVREEIQLAHKRESQ